MLTFVLLFLISNEPLVFGFVDGFSTAEKCNVAMVKAEKLAKDDDKKSFRCIKMILGDEPI